MSRAFTPSQRAAIASAKKSGTPTRAIAKRFHVREAAILVVCAEVEAMQAAGKLTPAPYAVGYRTAVYGVCECGPLGIYARSNLMWGTRP